MQRTRQALSGRENERPAQPRHSQYVLHPTNDSRGKKQMIAEQRAQEKPVHSFQPMRHRKKALALPSADGETEACD